MNHRAIVRAVLAGTVMTAPFVVYTQGTRPGATPQGTAALPDSTLNAQTAAIAATLRCPVCQGESIQDSPSELAAQMRAIVREQLSDGRTPNEVKAYFVARYGEWILLEPSMTGMNVLLYAFPVLLVAGGLWLVVTVVRKWSAQTPASGS